MLLQMIYPLSRISVSLKKLPFSDVFSSFVNAESWSPEDVSRF